ncbi:MAG: PQQ-dependent sugar dehydrogenase [bacterium]|nr:PQQ-dependent sugar dehydrogenase [bacterium]
MRKIILIGFPILLLVGVFLRFFLRPDALFLPKQAVTIAASYEGAGEIPIDVAVFDRDVPNISHIEMTPDGSTMLVGTLGGTILAYQKIEGEFRRQRKPFFTVQTSQPGFPPEEAGLTGIALGADFETSGDIFLTYSFAKEEKSFRNRVMRVTFTRQGGEVIGTDPQDIFEAGTPGTGSHQIQDGVGILVNSTPHFLFTIGEGFVAERALDPKEEAGKVMLIGRDGSRASGERPFPESPNVQALGIRNAPAMAKNPVNGKIAIADTGPNNNDRFLYGTVFDAKGINNRELSFQWDGSEDSLTKTAPDLYIKDTVNMNLYQWAPTETAVNIVFYQNDLLPRLSEHQQYVLVTLFGRTGEPGNDPGKKIILGILADQGQPSIEFTPFIKRTESVKDELGHPLGLAFDAKTKILYFGDIMEGRIYKAQIKGK